MAEFSHDNTNAHEVEITFSSQELIEKLNSQSINPNQVLTRLNVDKTNLITLQNKLDQDSFLYELCDHIKNWPARLTLDEFASQINQLVYLWLNAYDNGHSVDDILNTLKSFKLKNTLGFSYTSAFSLFLYNLFIESLNRYHQITLDYVINYEESIQLPNTKLLTKNLSTTLNQARDGEITALFSLHFQTENNALLLPKSSTENLNKQIAHILKKNISEKSQLYFNGDYQFEVLIAQVKNTTQLDLMVTKLFRAFEEILFINKQSILKKPYIGCSYGIPNKLTATEMYHNAKKALEYGITHRQFYVVYSKELEKLINHQIALESKTIEAFDSNNLVLYFQPIVGIQHNKCVGAELLLRWPEKFDLDIAPNVAVDVLNSMGKGKLFTRWLVNSACRYVHEIETEHALDLYLTLNLRAEDLNDIELPSLFSNALSLWKLNPEKIILEITENGFLEHNEQTKSVIDALLALGFKFALDDFGTGFSSLTRLRALPIDLIKIDQSFVRNINKSKEDYEIVQSIAMLAKSLGKKVLCEGVENENILALIKKLEVDKCQGYHFAKPLSYEDFIKWAKAH